MAKSPNSYPIIILMMRIVSAIMLSLSVVSILTHVLDFQIGHENTKAAFNFISAFSYLIAGSAIGFLYNVLQMGPAVYLILTRKLLLSYPFELCFDILADQIIGYLLVSSGSAGFAVALKVRRDYEQGGEGLPSSVNYNLKKAEYSAVLGLIATLPMMITSMLSAYVLIKS